MKLPIEDCLRDIYEELPRSERLLADIIIDFPGDLATHSISELVARANTSNAAATRLIKRLGYKDFREVRKQAREAKAQGSPRYLHTIDHHSGDFKSEIKQHLDCEVQNLLSSSDSVGDLQKGPKSPSRSLFDLPKQGEPQTKPGYYSPSRRDDGSAQKKRQVSGGREGVPPSPRREQIRRVVLELDDLEL